MAHAIALSLVGCAESSPNDAPIIDYVDAPPVVSRAGNTFAIPLSIGFHDNDNEVITRVHYRSGPSIDGVVEIASPVATRQSADVTITISAAALSLAGDTSAQRELQITVVDGRGAESQPLVQMVTLK
jgi:hypothetical protein